MSQPPLATEPSLSDEKQGDFKTSEKIPHSNTDVESITGTDSIILRDERDIVTRIISVDDDPSLTPWTFRSFFLGIGLSTFGGVLGEGGKGVRLGAIEVVKLRKLSGKVSILMDFRRAGFRWWLWSRS